MSTLVVAEKPSVGRDIARVLGATKSGTGCLTNDSYIVTWAVGHLVTLSEPDEIKEEWKRWSIYTLPILPADIPLKVISQSKDQYAVVKNLMNSDKVDKIICATDAGREGELIFRYIYRMAGCKKPCERLWISSMTDAAIKAGFAALKPSSEYDGLYASACCRSEADWLVGMNATRAFTIRYDSLLSAGRVQTPTLALIVKRDAEIDAFVSKPYYEVTAKFGKYTGTWFEPKTQEARIDDKVRAEEIKKKVSGKIGTITECTKTQKREGPEKLYDLTTLQREANRKFGYSADKTLEIAQALYERHKIITYPRTDSRFLPDDMKPKVAKTLGLLPEPYKGFVEQIVPVQQSTRIYDNSKISDHHAIIPTDNMSGYSHLNQDEKNIFDLVARRLIANHYPDRIYNSCRIITQCEDELFKTNCVQTVSDGWRALYAGEKPKDETVQDIPDVNKGDTAPATDVKVASKKTKAPQPYTDDTLLKSMEDAGKTIEDEELREKMKDSGLGTPATRAAIINRLIQVGYAKRVAKQIRATEKGKLFISVAPEEMTSAVTTGKWERALAKMAKLTDAAQIAEKQKKFMESIRRYSGFLVEYTRDSAPVVMFPEDKARKKVFSKKPTGRRDS